MSTNGSFRLFESSPQYFATLEGHTLEGYTGVVSIAFSPNGAMLATGGSYDGTVKLWDVKTRQSIATFDTSHEIYGTQALLCCLLSRRRDTGPMVHGKSICGTLPTQTQIATFAPHDAKRLAFSPDGTILASTSSGIKLWDVQTKQNIITLKEWDWDPISSLAFSPDGTMLASASKDNTIKLWDLKTNQIITALEGHKEQVSSLAFSPDGTMLVSGSPDYTGRDGETVKVWDVKTKQVIATFSPKWGTDAVAFSPDGAILASPTNKISIALWDVKTKQPVATLRGHIKGVTRMAFSPDGTTLASGDFDGNILLWDMSEFVTPVVIFADANLRAAIRDALGKSAFAPITVTDMAQLTVLDASNRDIRELDGLESATQLTNLNLEGNPLSSSAIATHIPALRKRGVVVLFDDKPTATPDFDGDNAVTIADFLLFVAQFGLGQGDAEYGRAVRSGWGMVR